MQFLFYVAFTVQKLILLTSYYICGLFVRSDGNLWVIGVDEIANNINLISEVFDKKYSVNLSYNKYYPRNYYTFSLSGKNSVWLYLQRLLVGPVLLGYLAHKAKGVFYIWKTGFLVDNIDGRNFEFSFLKDKGIEIATFFCGTDIRSLKLSIEHAEEHGMEAMATYQGVLNPNLLGERHETSLKKLAASADKYADHIFNAPVDQISYIKREVHPFLYFYPDERFQRNDAKFISPDRIKIVHAPSSPLIKGTALLRAAIKNLKLDGYDFDYVEIINSENSVVLEHLRTTHIVVNELYAFMPGLFGVEAMAAHCAVLTSADERIEPNLPPGSNDAWMVTGYWQILQNLKYMLDRPEEIKRYADKGYDWAYEHCRASETGKKIRTILKA